MPFVFEHIHFEHAGMCINLPESVATYAWRCEEVRRKRLTPFGKLRSTHRCLAHTRRPAVTGMVTNKINETANQCRKIENILDLD